MNTPYILFFITFLVLPIVALKLSKYTSLQAVSKYATPVVWFFAVHNSLFVMGYSVKGDYFDYFVFSAEYFVFCFAIFLLLDVLKVKMFARIFRAIGLIAISIGFIIGFIGIFLFTVVSQDYESDKVFHFTYNGKNYETRRYSYGFVTLSDTRYTFETYRDYKFLPFEKKIDKTNFFGFKTSLNISEDGLKINIINAGNSKQLVFKSTNGRVFSKPLE